MTESVWWAIGGLVVGWLLRTGLAVRSRVLAVRAATAQADGLETELAGLRLTLQAASAERDSLVDQLGAAVRASQALRAESEAQARAVEEIRGERDRATARADQAVAAQRGLPERVSELESMVAEMDELRREVRLLADQRTGLANRLEQLTRHFNRIDGERTHAVLLVETVERQFKQLAASASATRALQATELLDLKRQLEGSTRANEELRSRVAAAESERDELTRRQIHVEADRRAAALSHQEALAALQAELGAVQALAERAGPLRRQLEDREGLVRSVASERDEATRALVHREREWIVQVSDLETEVVRLEALLQRAGTAEALLAVSNRERDDFAAALRTARVEIATLATEIKDRDHRFRALLDDRRQFAEASQDQIAHLLEQTRRAGDDLKRISGIGPHLEGRLKAHGITTFRQIAQWSDSDIERISKELGPFAHRIRRDRWVEQAQRECEVEGQPAA